MEVFKKSFPEGSFLVFDNRPDFDLNQVQQVHGTNIVSTPGQKADGLISSENMAILTADCMPILLIGKNESALIHAGWRGLHAGILKKDIIKDLKVKKGLIGPHIQDCCFEVTSEFLTHFPHQYFKKNNGKLYFSLKDVAMLHLKSLLGDIDITCAQECTHCDKKFHSFRRNQTIKRNWNIWKPNIVDTKHVAR